MPDLRTQAGKARADGLGQRYCCGEYFRLSALQSDVDQESEGVTAASKRYLEAVHTLPCVIHLNCYAQKVNAQEAHHLEFVRGPHSDFATIPVCKPCHDELHEMRRRSFYRAHKLSDIKLLAWTIRLRETS